MQFSQKLIAFVAALQTAQAGAILGFNYGATKSDGYTLMQQADFETLFTKAQNLVGTSGFNAARLYTSIQTGTTPSEAFAAAMATNTKLLLGLWASSGSQTIENEIAAIKTAISDNGSKFTDLVIGVSVGSEDLYRISPTGILNKENPGAGPEVIANYISQVKSALGSSLPGIPVGHVDTWTAWANSSNSAAAVASDFIGVDAYPYFQNTMANSIEASRGLFDDAIAQVKQTVGQKNVWITETGFPVSGPTENLAVPSAQNAKAYWDAVGCGELFNVTNTFWYTLEDNYGGQLSSSGPSFGIVGSNGQELFDLSCSNINKTPASSASVSGTASVTDAGSPGATKLPPGVGSGSSSSGNSSSGSGSGSSSVSGSPSVTTSYTPMTTTNSAGVTITTSVASNITVGGGSGSSATPVGPTSSTTAPATGAGANLVAPVAGVFAAIMAAFAYL